MKHRGVKPTPQQSAAARRQKILVSPSSRPSPTLLSDTDAGPRPVSHRQQATKAGYVTGEDIIERLAPRRAKPVVPPAGMRPRVRRDAETTRVRRRRQRVNRRRIDYLSLFLKSASAALFVEIVVVLLFSPRFYVTRTTVEGNTTIPAGALLAQLAVGPRQNIVRLPVNRLQKTILAANPMIETAEIHRTLPGSVQLIVHERIPWASVCLPDGACYTIDKNLVPFRVSSQPELGLPRLRIAQSADTGSAPAELGKALATPGLGSVSRWLQWAYSHSFPIESIEIAPDGKLCLNRTGNLQVQVGSDMDLEKKVKSISTLLERRPALRTRTDVAYINLFAYDAPAIGMRVTRPARKTGAKQKDSATPDGGDPQVTNGVAGDRPAAFAPPEQVIGNPQ